MQPHNNQNNSEYYQNNQPSNYYYNNQGYYQETQYNEESNENNDVPLDVNEINFEENNSQKPKYMYKYFWNKYTRQYQFNLGFMFPFYYKYFKELQKTLEELAETINKKWTEDQRVAYVTFLTDVNNYIKAYIWTKLIYDFNYFKNQMRRYSEQSNPVGAELYDTQLGYLHKKSIGYDFFQDKKKKKEEKKFLQIEKTEDTKPERLIVREVKQRKQQQVLRAADPLINIPELRSRKWAQDKYTDIQIFKKDNANVVFIGHVDSGKSTLVGNILKELNEVDQQQWQRNKLQAKQNHMEAWELAGIADVDPAQRKRGKTIEYAKLMFHFGERRFTVFDAPGHKNYVPNMIMGACQADIAVLIISAKSGEFQAGFVKEGQTREHALLAKTLGVSSIIVAITKMSTVEWSQSRFNEIKNSVSPFLKETCGYPEVKFIPIDSINNLNIHQPIQSKWYKGQNLLRALQKIALPERNTKGPLRVPIIDKFKEVGNLFLYGKVQSGVLIQNQTVTLLPQRKEFSIKQIYNAKDERLPYAVAGQNLKLKVKGIQDDEVTRGNMICNNLNYCLQSQQFKALITVIQLPEQKKLLSSGYEGVIHMHAVSQNMQIVKIQNKINKENKSVPASFLLPGQTGHAVIKIQSPICLQKFQFMPNLGRFTLRDEGKTIGYGQVLKIKPFKALMKEQKEQLVATKEVQQQAK